MRPKLTSKTVVFFAIIVFILAANNCVYYILTRNTLESNMERELQSIVSQIRVSAENSHEALRYLEDSIGEQLRLAAIAAQAELDPDIENVRNEELAILSKKLVVSHITLLKQAGDDIILYKSSNPNEIGLSTKAWKPWHQAFQQLFDLQRVTIGWGQSLPNFWSGPFEYASSDPDKARKEKWGYYYDGTTNYIIDPYISDIKFEYFLSKTGIDAILAKTMETNRNILDISGMNPVTFGTEEMTTITERGKLLKHNTPRPVVYGEYRFAHGRDAELIKRASATGREVHITAAIDGRQIMKTYIPMPVRKTASITDKEGNQLDHIVLVLVTDYELIHDKLRRQFSSLAIDTTLVMLISLFLIIAGYRFFGRSKEKAVRETQEVYIEELNQMFTAIKGQRHDFLNHVQTIQSLVQMNKFDALKRYTAELTGEVVEMNDMIQIGQPAISALIRSKVTTAQQRKIKFSYRFGSLSKLGVGIKSVDIVKIIGNLVDNAFDAVSERPESARVVELQGEIENGMLRIEVMNPVEAMKQKDIEEMFTPGFTTKKESGHTGIGLAVTRQLIDRYEGSIDAEFAEGRIKFTVTIPMD